MQPTPLFISCGIIFGIATTSLVRADQLDMQNGDRYIGKILSVSADTVQLQSEVLGKINLPRTKVATLAFGTNAIAPKVADQVASATTPTNLPDAAAPAALTKSNTNASSSAEVIKQIREQMLASSPEAAGKYDELAAGLMSGKLNVNDIQREAKSSADQLRKLKVELGPEAGDSLDVYLQVLDNFLKESSGEPTNAAPVVSPKVPVR